MSSDAQATDLTGSLFDGHHTFTPVVFNGAPTGNPAFAV